MGNRKTWIKPWKKPGRSRGVSLAEMLVVVLILSLVTVAAASGISAARRVYSEVQQKTDAQTLLSTSINAIAEKLYCSRVWTWEADDTTPEDLTVTGEKGIYYIQSTTAPGNQMANPKKETSVLVDVIYSEGRGYLQLGNGTKGEDTENPLPLVTSKTQTLGLYASLKNGIHYKDGVYTFTVQVCTDKESDDGTTTQKVIEEQDVSIRTALVP